MQQDNALAHIAPDDVDVLFAGDKGRTVLLLINQPPNSPGFNILGLGFFRAIQSLQLQACTK